MYLEQLDCARVGVNVHIGECSRGRLHRVFQLLNEVHELERVSEPVRVEAQDVYLLKILELEPSVPVLLCQFSH
jgi:hypothetical protein